VPHHPRRLRLDTGSRLTKGAQRTPQDERGTVVVAPPEQKPKDPKLPTKDPHRVPKQRRERAVGSVTHEA
jgi:hypothetical protein